MGIDIYLYWDGQTDDEKEAQYTGFVNAGGKGYLREAYSQDYLATPILFPEDKHTSEPIEISNNLLKNRLQIVEKTMRENDEPESEIRQWHDFVKLHYELEKSGKNPKIIIR